MPAVSVTRIISRLFAFLSTVILFASALFATPNVVVISPENFKSSGSAVFFEAYATSASCSKGIAAMRIYSAPYTNAYTVNGSHIETFVTLKPGTYNAVVQAWDNCGGVGKAPVTFSVNSDTAITVFLPDAPTGQVPNHFAASVQSPSCAAGINAMRIYTANGVAPYTVHTNHLNTFVNLLPGTYNFTVQAWDNCGKVIKDQFTQNIGGVPDGYLYAVDNTSDTVSEFQINNGVLTNPNGSGTPPQFPAPGHPNFIAVDPGGWFAYVLSNDGIYAYQISQSDGSLAKVSGSPFANGGEGPSDIAIDPNGNFVFATYEATNTLAIYKIDRSSGALTKVAAVTGSGGLFAVNADSSGQYVYAVNFDTQTVQVFGYKINLDTGALSAVPESPYTVGNSVTPQTDNGFALGAISNYLYVGTQSAPTGQAFGYTVNFSTGALTPIQTSTAWVLDEVLGYPQALLVDNQARYLWAPGTCPDCSPGQNWFTKWDILSGGDLGNHEEITNGTLLTYALAEDSYGSAQTPPGSQFPVIYPVVYGVGIDQNNCSSAGCPSLVTSYTVGMDGTLTKLSGPLTVSKNSTVFGIGVSVKAGQ